MGIKSVQLASSSKSKPGYNLLYATPTAFIIGKDFHNIIEVTFNFGLH